MARRIVKVNYNGVEYELKVTLNSLRLAEEYSGITITKAFANEIPISFIQGFIYGELKELGAIGDLSYDDFGKSFDDISQISNIILDFWQAIAPDEVFTDDVDGGSSSPKPASKGGRGNK